MASIRFLAAGTVTGSRFLVESGSSRVLVDSGLFQGGYTEEDAFAAGWPAQVPRHLEEVAL